MDRRLFKILEKVYHKKKYVKDENGYQHLVKNGDIFDCDTRMTLENLIAAYLCGFSSFPRGRQPILSYLFAKAVPEHIFTPFENGDNICSICSMSKHIWIQKGEEIFRKYWGYAWNERWDKYLVELQEFSELSLCIPTEEDIQIFCAVIDVNLWYLLNWVLCQTRISNLYMMDLYHSNRGV